MLATWTETKEPADHAEKYGRYNDPPPNFKEITEGEFSRSYFMTYSPEFVEWRQIRDDSKKTFTHQTSIHLFYYYDGTGLGIVCEFWNNKVRYFKFALCEHEYTEENIRMCLHKYTCKKCGYSKTVDSSD